MLDGSKGQLRTAVWSDKNEDCSWVARHGSLAYTLVWQGPMASITEGGGYQLRSAYRSGVVYQRADGFLQQKVVVSSVGLVANILFVLLVDIFVSCFASQTQ